MAKKSAESSSGATFDSALVESSAEQALASLAQAGAAACDLIDAWVGRGNAAAVAVAAEQGQGPARKAARRGLNVLKSRGVAPPARARVATLGATKGDQQQEAFMLPPDASGNVMLVVASRAPTSRCQAVFALLNDDVGLLRIETGELSQSQLKGSMARLLPTAESRPTKVPVGWARARVARAKIKHTESGAHLPLGLSSAADLLEPVPADAPPHPFDEEGLELSDEDATELAKNCIELHRLPEFRGWFPEKPALDEILRKVGENLTPGQQPDPERVRELMDKEIAAATDRYFSPERRDQLVRAMKDSALSVLAREGETKALEVVACTKVIARAGLITDPPHEVGFLRGFFEKGMSALIAQSGGNLRLPIPVRPDQPPAESPPAESPPAESAPAESPPAESPPEASQG